ncbi:MAG: hypothetical protein LBF97_07740 [Elusimicrobiota bacterium]|jgi:hypothetical protein|nr:hypothetical protein [Elusimicrobiota bacterium]
MLNRKNIISLMIILVFFFVGCTDYNQYFQSSILPQHIKKIAIVKFQDTFNKPAFQDKLYFTLKDRLTIDRRVDVVNLEMADAVILGRISRYLLQPLQFDGNKNPIKFMLWVWVDISLYDVSTKNILWTEEKLEAKVEFNRNSSDSSIFEPTTETEAQDIAIDKLANIIIKRTIDGWFAASGVKETVYS